MLRSLNTTLIGSLIIAAACGDAAGPSGPPNTLQFSSNPETVRQGDPVSFAVDAFDANGTPIDPIALSWSVEPFGTGEFPVDTRFVGYQPGPVEVIVSHGSLADTMALEIQARAVPAGSLTTLGRGFQIGPWNTDLWVHGNYVFSGSFSRGSNRGNELFIWDVAAPSNPVQLTSFTVDAAVVNDVKLRPDGQVAALTHEGSNDGRNGFTLVDVADPSAPRLLTRFVDGLAPGVHNVWYQGQYLYLAVNDVGGLHILDVSDPRVPRRVATFYAGSSFVHDVYVRDGLAFVSHWDAGLVILDVGNGIAGGLPTSPVEVARIVIPGVKVHNAWYWPARGYVFIGDEVTGPGSMYVVDVADLHDPQLVAEFRTPDTTGKPHNFWVDETRNVLWLSWYRDGIYALDATGGLLGRLDLQSRTIMQADYSVGSAGCFDTIGNDTCAWAPQVHNGKLYVSDVNSGLWIFQPEF
jgi:hypothetical protein